MELSHPSTVCSVIERAERETLPREERTAQRSRKVAPYSQRLITQHSPPLRTMGEQRSGGHWEKEKPKVLRSLPGWTLRGEMGELSEGKSSVPQPGSCGQASLKCSKGSVRFSLLTKAYPQAHRNTRGPGVIGITWPAQAIRSHGMLITTRTRSLRPM